MDINGHDNMTRMWHRAVVNLLVLVMVIAGYSRALSGQSQDTLKVTVDLVNVQFSVTDRQGRFVPGLTAQDFKVEEDGRRQEIRNFARENELPLTLALLVDTSPSVRPVFDEEKLTAASFLESILREKDLALVIGFDQSVTLLQDYTENLKLLKRAIDELEIGGGTSIYDAVYLAGKEKLTDEAGRKAIILISDGEDTTSKTKLTEALVAAHKSNAVIYAISNALSGGLFGRGRPGLGGFGGGSIRTLRKFSEETGGSTFVVGNENSFAKIFDQIAQELRSQYSLGYVSLNTARDGKYRQIKVTARQPGYIVKSRKGYYAPRS
ncbi:MAG: VWA domain-containing protein [Acidobacteria bacterium]|nr:MAG: VWA domain-containing protein [Acidobacteriota bacterium]